MKPYSSPLTDTYFQQGWTDGSNSSFPLPDSSFSSLIAYREYTAGITAFNNTATLGQGGKAGVSAYRQGYFEYYYSLYITGGVTPAVNPYTAGSVDANAWDTGAFDASDDYFHPAPQMYTGETPSNVATPDGVWGVDNLSQTVSSTFQAASGANIQILAIASQLDYGTFALPDPAPAAYNPTDALAAVGLTPSTPYTGPAGHV